MIDSDTARPGGRVNGVTLRCRPPNPIALIYDDPVDNSVDFCFARFSGVDAQTLQAHIEQNTIFA